MFDLRPTSYSSTIVNALLSWVDKFLSILSLDFSLRSEIGNEPDSNNSVNNETDSIVVSKHWKKNQKNTAFLNLMANRSMLFANTLQP